MRHDEADECDDPGIGHRRRGEQGGERDRGQPQPIDVDTEVPGSPLPQGQSVEPGGKEHGPDDADGGHRPDRRHLIPGGPVEGTHLPEDDLVSCGRRGDIG